MAQFTRIQIRNGKSQEWFNSNPILVLGEPGFESDTNRFKIGDGITRWNNLTYMSCCLATPSPTNYPPTATPPGFTYPPTPTATPPGFTYPPTPTPTATPPGFTYPPTPTPTATPPGFTYPPTPTATPPGFTYPPTPTPSTTGICPPIPTCPCVCPTQTPTPTPTTGINTIFVLWEDCYEQIPMDFGCFETCLGDTVCNSIKYYFLNNFEPVVHNENHENHKHQSLHPFSENYSFICDSVGGSTTIVLSLEKGNGIKLNLNACPDICDCSPTMPPMPSATPPATPTPPAPASIPQEIGRKLYGWGLNNFSQIGNGRNLNTNRPVKIGNDDWKMVSCGGNHTLGINTKGELYAWGCNSSGELGNNTTISKNIPTRIGVESNWVYVSAGTAEIDIYNNPSETLTRKGGYSFAINEEGELYGWGYNKKWNIGNGSCDPGEIWGYPKFSDCDKAGLSAPGELKYYRASNPGAGLGLEIYPEIKQNRCPDGPDAFVPTRIGTNSNWLKVVAGHGWVAALNNQGEIYIWGEFLYFPLIELEDVRYKPTRVKRQSWYQAKFIGINGRWDEPMDTSSRMLYTICSPYKLSDKNDWVDINGREDLLAVDSSGDVYICPNIHQPFKGSIDSGDDCPPGSFKGPLKEYSDELGLYKIEQFIPSNEVNNWSKVGKNGLLNFVINDKKELWAAASVDKIRCPHKITSQAIYNGGDGDSSEQKTITMYPPAYPWPGVVSGRLPLPGTASPARMPGAEGWPQFIEPTFVKIGGSEDGNNTYKEISGGYVYMLALNTNGQILSCWCGGGNPGSGGSPVITTIGYGQLGLGENYIQNGSQCNACINDPFANGQYPTMLTNITDKNNWVFIDAGAWTSFAIIEFTPTPTPTPTSTPPGFTHPPTPTPTETEAPTPTPTPTETEGPTPTPTETEGPTPTPTNTPTPGITLSSYDLWANGLEVGHETGPTYNKFEYISRYGGLLTWTISDIVINGQSLGNANLDYDRTITSANTVYRDDGNGVGIANCVDLLNEIMVNFGLVTRFETYGGSNIVANYHTTDSFSLIINETYSLIDTSDQTTWDSLTTAYKITADNVNIQDYINDYPVVWS